MDGAHQVRRNGAAAWAAAALATFALVAALTASQPLDRPWWSAGDFYSIYVRSGLSLFGGHRSDFVDHPGTPLQNAAALAFTAEWLVSGGDESREERADAWFRRLDATRPLMLSLAAVTLAISALVAGTVVGALLGGAAWGLLAAALFVAAPGLLTQALIPTPDALVAALSVVATAACALAWRRLSPVWLLAAAAVSGFAMTAKLHAVGLLVPLALTLLARPPAADWTIEVRAAVRRRRRRLAATAGVWFALVLLVNAATPPTFPQTVAVAAVAGAAVAVAAIAYRLSSRRVLGARMTSALAVAAALVLGAIVPNALYVSQAANALGAIILGSLGRGGHSELAGTVVVNVLHPGKPWLPLFALAAVGLLRALRARETDFVVWAASAGTMWALAALHLGALHYFAPAAALSIPLALRAFRGLRPHPLLVAAPIVALLVTLPARAALREVDAAARQTDKIVELNMWLRSQLGADEVAVTERGGADHWYLVRIIDEAPWAPQLVYRLVPPGKLARDVVRRQRSRIRMVVTTPESAPPERLLEISGGRGVLVPVAHRDGVYRVAP